MSGRAQVAASILDADLSNLGHAVRRAAAAGADRIHLDVMDGHFVPNLTFGARMIRDLRRHTRIPFDAHLMIAEPWRYLDDYLEAGCDSVTIHVEIAAGQVEPTLARIRAAGRAAGLALRPGTPLAALEPYRPLLDIVMVMTVEPGFGGQSFMTDVAEAKVLAARDHLAPRPVGGEVHVDGGVNRETAERAGALAADVLVVGSALWVKGHGMAREIRLVKALADEGFQYGRNHGEPPPARGRWVRAASLPRSFARVLADEMDAADVPVLVLRGDGPLDRDGVREYELLVPAEAEAFVADRFRARIAELRAAAAAPDGAGAPPDLRAPGAAPPDAAG